MNYCRLNFSVLKKGMKNDLNVDQIKKLWILDLIIQTGSFKGAAARARISPSAISQSLSALEGNVGKRLVIRNKGSVIPTQDALNILEIVRPAFQVFDRLNEIGRDPIPHMDWLSFGTYESIAVDILPGLVHSLREKMPKLRLSIRINRTDQLLTMVRKGELCSAIVTEVDDLDKFYCKTVYVDRLGVYASPKHPTGQMGSRAIERFGFGSLAPGRDGLPRYYTRFMKRFHTMKPLVLSESIETLRAAAVSGAITAVLPHRVAMRTNDLVEITPDPESKDNGAHQILVVSPNNCDRDEADYLAKETSQLLARSAPL